MKKLIVFAAAIALSASAFAQGPWSIEAGYDNALWKSTTTTSALGQTEKDIRSTTLNGFHVGGAYHWSFSDMFGLSVGVQYQFLKSSHPMGMSASEYKKQVKDLKEALKDQGFKSIHVGDDYFSHQIQVPVRGTVSFHFGNDMGLSLFTGPMLSFAVSRTERDAEYATKDGKKEGTLSVFHFGNGKTEITNWVNGQADKQTIEPTDNTSKLDPVSWSWGVGAAASWRSFFLGVSYDFGLSNLSVLKKTSLGGGSISYVYDLRQNDLKISLGYRF